MSDLSYPRTIDGEVDIVVDDLTVNGSATFNGTVSIGTIDLDNITCTSLTASGPISGSTITSSGLLRGAVVRGDNLVPQQIVYGDAASNLQSIASSTAGFVLTSNGAAAPTFQAAGGFTGILPIANGGTASSTATGSGQTVLQTSPTLVTPNIGVASGTSLSVSGTVTGLLVDGTDVKVQSAGASQAVQTDPFKKLVTIANTGSGNNVLSASPTLTGTVVATNINASGTLGGLLGQFSNAQVASSLTLQAATPFSTLGVNNIGVISYTGPGTTDQVLTSNGAGASATFKTLPAINLATGVTGTLPEANGGTGQTVLSAVTVGNATNAVSATNVAGGVNGQVVVQTGVGATGFVGPGTNGQVLTSNGATSSFQNPATVSLTSGVSGTLPVANGGTGVTTSTGTGSVVLSDTPTFVSPNLGDAEASSLHTTNNIGCDLKIFTTDIRVLSTSANSSVQTNGLKDLVTVSNTGTGSNVMSTSPTLVTPILGVASATSLSLGTALGVTSGGTGQTSLSAVTVGNATTSATSTNIAGGATGQLVVQSGAGTTGFLAIGANGQRLTSNGTTPVWVNPLPITGSISFITTPFVFTANTTLTAAQLLAGVMFQNSGVGGTVTLTLPTAASIIAILGSATNTFIQTKIIQTPTNKTINFTTGTGVNIVDYRTVVTGTSQYLLIQVTSGTAVTVIITNN